MPDAEAAPGVRSKLLGAESSGRGAGSSSRDGPASSTTTSLVQAMVWRMAKMATLRIFIMYPKLFSFYSS